MAIRLLLKCLMVLSSRSVQHHALDEDPGIQPERLHNPHDNERIRANRMNQQTEETQ